MPKLSIDVEARYASFGQQLEGIKRDTGAMVASVESAFGSLNKLFAVAGVGSIFGGISALIKSTANDLDNLAKSAQAVGVSVESLSALRYAASFAGVSAEQLDRALVQLSDRVQKFAQGNKEAGAVFDSMRVAIRGVGGDLRPTEEILGEIADRFESYQDGAAKTALAADLFGQKIGPQLIPFLNAGSAGLAAFREEAERLGLVIGTGAAKDAERFNDELGRLGKQLEAIKTALAGPVIQQLANLIELFNRLRSSGAGIGQTVGLLDQLIGGGALGNGSPQDILKRYEEQIDSLVKKRDKLAAGGNGLLGSMANNPRLQAEANKRHSADIAALDEQIQQARKLRDELAGVYKLYPDYASQMGQSQGKLQAPIPPGGSDKTGAERVSEAARLLESLQRQVESAAELTAYEQTLLAIDRAKQPFTRQQREEAVALARQIDDLKELNQEKQRTEALNALIAASESRFAQALEAEVARYKDIADPVEKYRRELERIDELQANDKLTQRDADVNRQKIYDQIIATAGLNEKLKDTTDIAKQLGLTFESAFEKVLFEGGKVKDLLSSIAIDFAKLFVRQRVTQPLLGVFDSLLNPAGPTQAQIAGFQNPEALNLVDQVLPAASISQTINVSQGVSASFVADAVAQGNSALLAQLGDNRVRGGAFA